MSEPIKDGGPAFPCEWKDFSPTHGMTLRDYFAAKAMQGMLCEHEQLPDDNSTLARWSYDIADAMLAAREPK